MGTPIATLKLAFIVFFILLIFVGCSNSDSMVGIPIEDEPAASASHGAETAEVHYLWGMYDIYSEDLVEFNITPMRYANAHYNIRTFLEHGPCANCIKIINPHMVGPDTIELTIRLIHPFANEPFFCGFDVRGIAMFRGSCNFPIHDVKIQGFVVGNPVLLNADGYTGLYNPVDFPPGSQGNILKEYSTGKWAFGYNMEATLNPFRDFYTGSNRHYFLAGDEVDRDYIIRVPPGVLNFGYAIDASWVPPTVNPPTQVPGDFPILANCPEAYQISITLPDGEELLRCIGDTAEMLIDIYDWQSLDDIELVTVECPAISGDLFPVTEIGYVGDALRFEVTIKVEVEPYGWDAWPVLVGVRDTKPSAPMAYQVIWIDSTENIAPIAAFEVDNSNPGVGQMITLTDLSYDPDGEDHVAKIEWDLDGDEEFQDAIGPVVEVSYDEAGSVQVCNKVTDICGEQALGDPITIEVKELGAIQITLAEDRDASAPGRIYKYYTGFFDSGAYPVDPYDANGPWNFTQGGFEDDGTFFAFRSPDDPEVEDLTPYFNPGVDIFHEISTVVVDMPTHFFYAAEFAEVQNVRKIWGLTLAEEGALIYAFPGPLVFPYPIEEGYSVLEEIGFPGLVEASFDLSVIGRGFCIVPLGDAVDTLLMRLVVVGETAAGTSGSALLFAWIDDGGIIRAFAMTFNVPPEDVYRFDEGTLEFTGPAAFYALYEISG